MFAVVLCAVMLKGTNESGSKLITSFFPWQCLNVLEPLPAVYVQESLSEIHNSTINAETLTKVHFINKM